ncbi:MAG: hypothetical protein VYB32_01550 [Pseudomonadota bacterium]|nr:hypothetical protein [Pseudomonadota bacterium]
MPADPADIAAASRDAVVTSWEGAAVAARYPNARDGLVAPARGFCDAAADAQAIVNARGALIGVERRRFAVEAMGIIWPDLSAGVPSLRVVDGEQAVDSVHLAARIEIDLDAEATSFETFG